MTIFKHRILYEKGTVQKLSKRFGLSEQSIRSALRYATEGETPDLIRKTALDEYGCVLSRKPIKASRIVTCPGDN